MKSSPVHSSHAYQKLSNISNHQRLTKIVALGSLLLGTSAIALSQIPRAMALEEIRVSFVLPFANVLVQDLVDFSRTGQAPQRIRELINLNRDLDEEQAHAYLTSESVVNGAYLATASYTEVGERFFRLAGNTFDVPDAPEQDWVYLREAFIDASADDRISPIEFLTAFDAEIIHIKGEKWHETDRRIKQDEDIMNFLRTAFPEME